MQVVVADDSLLFREGLVRLLEEQDFEVIAQMDNGDDLVRRVGGLNPDVAIVDIRMPPTNTDEGIRAAEHLRELLPSAGVVVLSQYADPQYALAFLEHGSQGRGYLLKERVSDSDQLANAIHEVARGGSVIDPKVIDNLVAARSKAAESPLRQLTPRETEILSEMAQGKNNAAIAETLVLSERAVEKHINSIFSKLGLSQEQATHRRVKAVLLYLADR
jgi:DNA-binding NarL/FixJ family response regulator